MEASSKTLIMGLLVYKFSEYDHTAEREQYRNLCKQLYSQYATSEELCIFIANYNIFDSELDGIIIKQDAIICVEFKNYGGNVIATDNGNWKLEDGTIIKGGSRKSVYQQARINRSALKNGFKDGGILSPKQLKDVATLVVFHQPISVQNNLSPKTRSWLYISDETTFMEKVCDITNIGMSLETEDMHELMAKLNLRDEYLDIDYSTYDSALDGLVTDESEDDSDGVDETVAKFEAVNSTTEVDVDRDKEQLRSFVCQIISTLFHDVNLSVRILTPNKIVSELPTEQMTLVKTYRYIALVNGERIASKVERLERFVHKKINVIDSDNIFWGEGEMRPVDSGLYNERPNQYIRTELSFRKSRTTLPHWLDKFLFEELSAVYAPEHSRYEYNLDLTENEVRVYLGTYFPRSYAETFCIVDNLFQNAKIKEMFNSKQNIRILDFCSGTGGELLGLLSSIDKYFADRKILEIVACDGNEVALNMLSIILNRYSAYSPHRINVRTTVCKVSSEESLEKLAIHDGEYDFILCNKAVCELISRNVIPLAYKTIAHYLGNMLSATGLFLLLDVTTKDEKSQRFYPQIMNLQLNELMRESEDLETLLPLSCGTYQNCNSACFIQQTFEITHRQKQKDESRVCYRILCKKKLKEGIWNKKLKGMTHVVYPQKYRQGLDGALCPKSMAYNKDLIDSFNIKIL